MTAGFIQQTTIFFRKTLRVAIRERFYKSPIFAAVIAFLVMFVIKDGMFARDNAYNTQSGFFTLCSACIWIGIFNSIQSVCREHEIIHADARAGMMISAYVIASMLWQFLLSLMESLIIFLVYCLFIDYHAAGGTGLILSAGLEYFDTIFLLIFGSSCLGLLISAIANNGTIAMTIMPFVLILQLIMCGTLFPINGFAKVIAVFTFSKWGMAAFGSIADINHLVGGTNPYTGESNFQHLSDDYNPNGGALIGYWMLIILLTAAFVAATILVLKLRNKEN